MKAQIDFQDELRLVFILCRLSILQTRLPIFSLGIKKLLGTKKWRESSTQQKLALLDRQHFYDLEKATGAQRTLIAFVRQEIEAVR